MLEEKFDALIKSYPFAFSSNQELKNQNEYLRCQLGEALKQNKKALESLIELSQGEDCEA